MLLMGVLTTGTALSSLADRGIGKKSKAKVTLNIVTATTLKKSVSLNLRSGLTYTGSLLTNTQATSNYMMSNSLVTYQKGNTVYIIPYKQKILVADMGQGYTGTKLIIRPH